jgi:hypothetical protein
MGTSNLGDGGRLQLLADTPVTPDTVNSYVFNDIQRVLGPLFATLLLTLARSDVMRSPGILRRRFAAQSKNKESTLMRILVVTDKRLTSLSSDYDFRVWHLCRDPLCRGNFGAGRCSRLFSSAPSLGR